MGASASACSESRPPAEPVLLPDVVYSDQDADEAVRRSHRFIATVADVAACLLYVYDLRTRRCIYTNRRVETMLGYAPAEVVGMGDQLWDRVLCPEDRDRVDHALKQVAEARDGEIVEVVCRVRDAAGDIRWVQTRQMVFRRHDDGSAWQLVGTADDITERKHLEQELTNLVLREQQRLGQELHDNVGQELTGLSYLAQGLREQIARDERPEPALADRLVAGLRTTLEHVRTLASGLFPVQVRAEELLDALEHLCASTRDRYGIACDSRFPDRPPIPPDAHDLADHLFRIVQEAVTNAIRHAAPSRIVISLRNESDHVVISVEDNGKGIPEGQVKAGGMGLRIMRHRATVIGAHLQIAPRPDGGTQVRCALRRSTQNPHTREENG